MQPNFIVNFALYPLNMILTEEFIAPLKVLRKGNLKFIKGFLKKDKKDKKEEEKEEEKDGIKEEETYEPYNINAE